MPSYLRQQNLQKCIIVLLSQPLDTFSHFLTTLCDVIELEQITVYADAVTLLTETEQLLNQKQAVRLSELFIELNWQAYLEKM